MGESNMELTVKLAIGFSILAGLMVGYYMGVQCV